MNNLNKDLDISKVVLNAITTYQNMPNTVTAIVNKGPFVTNVAEPHEVVGHNGVTGIKYKNIAIIDFTKPMTLNKEDFIGYTNHVYDEFCNISRWYFAGYDETKR